MDGFDLSNHLTLDPAGIWTAPAGARLAYPQDGHQRYFLIEDRSFWFAHRNNCIMAALCRHPPAGPVLDIGGGNGFVARRMLDEGFSAILLEPGKVGALNARIERDIPDVVCATLEDAGFPLNSVAAAGLFDVLEHIEDDHGFLGTVHARLRPEGCLYLTVPAFAGLWSASDVEAGHCRRYNPGRLRALMADRFEILFATCFFGALVAPIWALRALPFRLGLGRRGPVLAPEKEHGLHGGLLVRTLGKILGREVQQIKSGHPSGWGASYLCVARKKTP